MAKRVMVPLDRSARSEVALDAVRELCEPGDEVFLLSIDAPAESLQRGFRPGRVIRGGVGGQSGGGVSYTSRPDMPTYAETKDQTIQRQLDEMQDYLLSKSSALEKAGFRVEIGMEIAERPAEPIVDIARRINPTFIIMVRSTHPSVGERLFGTVPQHVIRENVAPVLILPVPD